MNRIWALFVIVAMLTLSVSPFAATVHRSSHVMDDSCPMVHAENDEPCIGAPCPCDHGSDGSLLPAGPLALPLAPRQLTPVAPSLPHTPPLSGAAQAGFPRVRERPPSRRA